MKWSAREDEIAFEMFSSGAGLSEISAATGRTEKAVKNRLWRTGKLQSVEWTDLQIKKLVDSYKAGEVVDVERIAKEIGKTKYAVFIKASRMGLGDPSRKVVKERKDRRKFKTADELRAHQSKGQRERIIKNGHPKGMLGKSHTKETKERLAESMRNREAELTCDERTKRLIKATKTKITNGTYAQPRQKTTWKSGWREIGGKRKYYRSRWEANYARYLEWLKVNGQILDWQHEAEVFWFNGVKRGCVSYLPDFKVTEANGFVVYHEVKGWMDSKSKTKIKRMAKYHPRTKLIVVMEKQYKEIQRKVGGLIDGWE